MTKTRMLIHNPFRGGSGFFFIVCRDSINLMTLAGLARYEERKKVSGKEELPATAVDS